VHRKRNFCASELAKHYFAQQVGAVDKSLSASRADPKLAFLITSAGIG
jgi:hypothetical protein